MRTVKINSVLKFIRDNTSPLNEMSNKELRSWIYYRLSNNNLYFFFDKQDIVGLVEWYRYKDFNELIWDFKSNKLLGVKGDILYINNILSKSGVINLGNIKKFRTFHNKLGIVNHIFRMSLKNNKYQIKTVLH